MVSIRYPSITDLSDSRGADLAFASMFDMSRGIKDERNAKKALDAFADSLYSGQGGGQQQPMSLAALEPRGQVSRAPLPATDKVSQHVARAHAASGGMPPQGAIEAYIRHAAQKRGIDPEVAVKVAMSEGGVTDPTRQSDVVKDGVREQSYGPFQLYMGGGLGNEFQQATGMHPSDPGAWQKGIDFALDKAKEGGWGPWYGADAAGIGARDGIGGPQAAMTGSEPSQGGGVPQSAPAGPQGGSLLPPPDVMRGLLRNPQTRELGVALAQSAIKARQGDPEAGLRLEKLRLEVEKLRNPDADGTEYGLNPIWGVDPETNEPVLGTMGKDGTFKRVDTGGVRLEAGVDRVDLGTQWGLLNKRTGQIEGYMPKDLAGAESQKEIGAADGKAKAAAGGDMQAAQNALDIIDSLRVDPNRQRGTGFSATFNAVPGTRGYDFQTKVDQAKSGAFLSAIQQLRGMGALSNAEGQTATAAVTRLNTATSEEEFMAALDDYEKIVRQGYDKAAARASAPAAGGGGVNYKSKYGLD